MQMKGGHLTTIARRVLDQMEKLHDNLDAWTFQAMVPEIESALAAYLPAAHSKEGLELGPTGQELDEMTSGGQKLEFGIASLHGTTHVFLPAYDEETPLCGLVPDVSGKATCRTCFEIRDWADEWVASRPTRVPPDQWFVLSGLPRFLPRGKGLLNFITRTAQGLIHYYWAAFSETRAICGFDGPRTDNASTSTCQRCHEVGKYAADFCETGFLPELGGSVEEEPEDIPAWKRRKITG